MYLREERNCKLTPTQFNKVLLELLTGAPVVEENRDPLTLYIDEMFDDGEGVDAFYDKRAGNWSTEVAERLYDLSVSCREYKPKKRPAMEKVRNDFVLQLTTLEVAIFRCRTSLVS